MQYFNLDTGERRVSLPLRYAKLVFRCYPKIVLGAVIWTWFYQEMMTGWRTTVRWCFWFNFFTLCAVLINRFLVQCTTQYCCRQPKSTEQAESQLLKSGIAWSLIGALLFYSLAYFRLPFNMLDSSEWVRRNNHTLSTFTGQPLAQVDIGVYLVTVEKNDYRTELVQQLQRFGLPAERIHFVPAVVADECEFTTPGFKHGLNFLHQAWNTFVQESTDACYKRCWIRCFPNGDFCPPESSPSKYETITCNNPAPVQSVVDIGEAEAAAASSSGNQANANANPEPEKIYINASHTFFERSSSVFEAAVSVSHLRAIRAAYLAGEETAIIMEDDASAGLVPYWSNIGLTEVLNAAPANWSVIQLHVWLGLIVGSSARIAYSMLDQLSRGHIVRCTHVCLISFFDRTQKLPEMYFLFYRSLMFLLFWLLLVGIPSRCRHEIFGGTRTIGVLWPMPLADAA